MKRIFIFSLALYLSVVGVAHAGLSNWLGGLFGNQGPTLSASVFFPYQGGTGTSSVPVDNSILLGNGTDSVYNRKTLTAGANITFTETGSTLTIAGAAGSAGVFEWTHVTGENRNATSSILSFNTGFISSGASSSISDALKLTNTVSCNTLDTDADGLISCGTDEGSGGPPNLIYRTLGATKYYTASSSATDNNVWHFNNGFNSSASSTVAGTLRVTDTATLLGGATITCTGCVADVNVADIALGGGTSGNYLRTLADSGNSTITVVGSGAEDADVTLNVVDVNCANCLNDTEIDDTFDWAGTFDGNNFAGGAIGTGELLYGGSAGSLSELAAGTRGTILSMTTGGIPGWVSTSTPFLDNLTCTDCFNATEIEDIYLFNNADDSTTGRLTAAGLTSSAAINATTTYHGSGSLSLDLTTAPQLFFLDDNTYTRWSVRNAGGNLYFATTTVASNATSSPFAMQLTGTGGRGLFVGTTTNNNATGLAVVGTWHSSGLATESGAGNVLCIKTNGVIVQDDSPLTACSGASSRTVKHDILNLDNPLSTILALRPVSYVYNKDYSTDQSIHLGLIAEEVEAVEPRLIDKGPVKGLKYAEFVAPIVGAIQELWYKVTNIDSRVERLEKENAELRDRIEALEQKL